MLSFLCITFFVVCDLSLLTLCINCSFYHATLRYAKRGICRRRVSICLSVCVCISHSSIVSKRLNIGSRKQRHTIAHWL